MMHMSPIGLALTKACEGLRLVCYVDPGGIPTIGWGSTSGLTLADVGVLMIDNAEANDRLMSDIGIAEAIVNQWVSVPLTQGQFDACVDFTFNEGEGGENIKDGFVWLYSGRHSTLLTKINAQDPTAADEFRKWDTNGPGGLTLRHQRQRELFQTGNWS